MGSEKSLPTYTSLDTCLVQAGNEMLWGSGRSPEIGWKKASPPLCLSGKVVHIRLTLRQTPATHWPWRGSHERTTSLAERQKSLVSDAGQRLLPPSWDVGPGLRFKLNTKCRYRLRNIFRAWRGWWWGFFLSADPSWKWDFLAQLPQDQLWLPWERWKQQIAQQTSQRLRPQITLPFGYHKNRCIWPN